ncbi:MAG: hypothetical protein ACR2GY_07840 [Phycisphaerales bacterium]
MARSPAFRTSAIGDLFRQLRYAPLDTRRRIMESAEALITDINREQNYPAEFITFRITGYRPAERSNTASQDEVIVGAAVLGDLSIFIRRLSEEIDLPRECPDRGRAMLFEEAAQQLGVSPRTLRRYILRGLVTHMVLMDERDDNDDHAARTLCVYERSLARFTSREGELLQRAESFSRLPQRDADVILAEAIAMHEADGTSRQEIARTLAKKYGRGEETIRTLLARAESEHDGQKLFAGRRRSQERDHRLAIRAGLRGIPLVDIAARLNRSRATVERILNTFRRERIRELDLDGMVLPTFSLADAEAVILSPAVVLHGLLGQPGDRDALTLLQMPVTTGSDLHITGKARAEALEAQLVAYHFLRWLTHQRAWMKTRSPSSATIDELETHLRWAALLKRSMIATLLPRLVLRIEQHIGRPLREQPAESIRAELSRAIAASSDAIDAVDLERGQSVERVASFAVDRSLKEQPPHPGRDRAAARHRAGSLGSGDPFAGVLVWQSWLELPRHRLRHLDGLDTLSRSIIERRYGLSGEAPRTIAQLSKQFELTQPKLRQVLREAHRMLRQPDP